MATRTRTLKRDKKNRFRPRIGWAVINGRRTQPFFNLGTDEKEAEWRAMAIRRLYDENCAATGEDTWSVLGLSYAKELASGRTTIKYPPLDPQVYDSPTLEYSQLIEWNRQTFPSLTIEPSDPELYVESRTQNKAFVSERLKELQVELRELGALLGKDSLPDELVTGSFYEALDWYEAHIKKTGDKLSDGTLKPYQRLRLKRIARFKREHSDFPLHDMNLAKCDELLAHWRNRPKTLWETEASDSDVGHHIGELDRFWRFLNSNGHWQSPRGLESLNRKVVKRERNLSVITKEIYSLDQLGIINRHATPLERLFLYVGLNCSMGAAEAGRLTIRDVLFNHQHEYAARLNFSSSPEDSFIRFLRPKTGVFGEWFLWPQTVEMLRWAAERSKSLGTDLIFVWDTGEPMYNERSTNAQAPFRKLWVEQLLGRVRKSFADFPELPPGTLRDTLPDFLRHRYDSELASMCIAHGSPFKGDSLLECYGNKPFGRLHRALRELGSHFSPVFDGIKEPTKVEKHYLPIATKERIHALAAEGVKPGSIAMQCDVSRNTVWRVLKAR